MNKISALEAYKVSIILEDAISKLTFLDMLKSNMGEEMTEMMSEEISRVMNQQRDLEKTYANLVKARSELKGLSNKHKLEDVKSEILRVAKELKESTRILCRQLQESPDVEGNQRKIKLDKAELMEFVEIAISEIRELSYQKFKNDVKDGLDQQGQFERLRNKEKELNLEIKKLNEDFKKAQDEFAKEALENNQEIMNLKKQVNETKTEAELQVQYREREMEGKLSCSQRLNNKIESQFDQQISQLQKQLKTEQLVNDRIRDYMRRKTEILQSLAEERDKHKDKRIEQLIKHKEDILKSKVEHEAMIDKINADIEEEDEKRRKHEKDEEEKQEKLEKERQMKMEMEDASRYIQRKWEWFNTVGRALAKKRKKGKKGKKKKK